MIKNMNELEKKLVAVVKKIYKIRYVDLKDFSELFDYCDRNPILNSDVMLDGKVLDWDKTYSEEEKEKITSENADRKIKEFIKIFEEYVDSNKVNDLNVIKFLNGLLAIYKLTIDLQINSNIFTIDALHDRNDIVNIFVRKFIDRYKEYVDTYHKRLEKNLNVKDMFLSQLDSYKEDLGEVSMINEDYLNKYESSNAIDILKKLIGQRFDTILKQYNNDMIRAWDKFSVERILNEASLYV